eukprot:3403309-Alexandrium_andersonii.AAC.1
MDTHCLQNAGMAKTPTSNTCCLPLPPKPSPTRPSGLASGPPHAHHMSKCLAARLKACDCLPASALASGASSGISSGRSSRVNSNIGPSPLSSSPCCPWPPSQ